MEQIPVFSKWNLREISCMLLTVFLRQDHMENPIHMDGMWIVIGLDVDSARNMDLKW